MTLHDYIKEILLKLEFQSKQNGNFMPDDTQELYNILSEIAETATEHEFCEVMSFYHFCPSSFHELHFCPVDEFYQGCCFSCWREHLLRICK